MIINEVVMDIFEVPHDYYLAHCISSDLVMGAGIAVEFQKRYNIREMLVGRPQRLDHPKTALTDRVFNLITKEKYFHKPTYASLYITIEQMKTIAGTLGITKIAMPTIGCGLDKLEWKNVKNMITEVFNETEVEILVCRL